MGNKRKDFADFKRAAFLIENKSHLTEDGLNQILSLKSGMNKGR